MLRRANSEGWAKLRERVYNNGITEAEQKIANVMTSNATIAERIREKLLKRLEAEIDKLPETIGTEMEKNVSSFTYEADNKKGGGRVKSRTDGGMRYKLRDLTAAYKDLTDNLPKDSGSADDPLMAVLKRWNDAAGIE